MCAKMSLLVQFWKKKSKYQAQVDLFACQFKIFVCFIVVAQLWLHFLAVAPAVTFHNTAAATQQRNDFKPTKNNKNYYCTKTIEKYVKTFWSP